MKRLDRVFSYWKKQLEQNGEDFHLFPGEDKFFSKLLKIANSSDSILDIGVGKGRMVKLLKQKGVGTKFYGIDITANVKYSDTIGVIGDCRLLPFRDNVFDLTYSLGVVEHFPETRLAIHEHARIVKVGGYVLATTPRLSIFTPLRYIHYLFKDRKKGTFEEIRGRNISLKTMKKYFKTVGLEIIDSGCYGAFRIKKILRNKKARELLLSILSKKFGAFSFILGKKG